MNTITARLAARFALLASCLTILALLATPSFTPPSKELLAFTSSGHVLGFRSDAMFVASRDHALRVEFVNANDVSPQADGAQQSNDSARSAPTLTRVTYPNLWNGVTLAYDAPNGEIARSTYTLAPFADAAQIELRYNAPLVVSDDGGLSVAFETGALRETSPIAWQVIDGARVSVQVSFVARGERQVGFALGEYARAYPLQIDPSLTWNTFLGSNWSDYGNGIAIDGSGNVYVAGKSDLSWGAGECAGCPVRAHDGSSYFDAFVAKLDANGALMWNTFLGGSMDDEGDGIAVDGSGNVYVAGQSKATWGAGECTNCPIRAFSGSGYNTFAAKLDATSGALTWNTFLGESAYNFDNGIAVDGNGNVYVTGQSDATWGAGECTGCPIRAHSGNTDALAAKLDSSGALVWNTFLGGSWYDYSGDVAIDGSGNVYVAGYSSDTWGSPVRAFTSGGYDAFAAKLDSSGALTWNTFLGSSGYDFGFGIAVDGNGNVYVTGQSDATWGAGECTNCPIRAHSGYTDALAAKLDSNGGLTWNTFLGGDALDYGNGIAVDGGGNVYVTGQSDTAWGSPVRAITSGGDAFGVKLASSGALAWNTFLGGNKLDYGNDIAVDGSGNVYVTGESGGMWGAGECTNCPIRAFSGGGDAFVVKYDGNPSICTSQANGNWSEIPTWDCGHVPVDGDHVVIANAHTVTLDTDTANLGSFTLNSGGALTNNGSSHTLSLTGDWSNSGTFTPSTYIGVTLDGASAQTLIGATAFYNLTINNTGGSVTLANDMTVDGVLTLTSDLTTASNVLNLGSGATVAGDKDVVGTTRRASPATGSNLQFNNQYTLLNFTTAPSQMDVTLTKSVPPDFSNAVQRYYTLTPTGAANATVQLSYQTSELNGNTEANMQLWRYDSVSSNWIGQGGTVDQPNHFIWVSNISQFSRWAFGDKAPTSIDIASFHAQLNKQNKVVVKWATGNELNLVGFNVWRKTGRAKWKRINAQVIAAKQIGQITGVKYRLTDKKVKAGSDRNHPQTYRYKLEILHADGTSAWTDIVTVKMP